MSALSQKYSQNLEGRCTREGNSNTLLICQQSGESVPATEANVTERGGEDPKHAVLKDTKKRGVHRRNSRQGTVRSRLKDTASLQEATKRRRGGQV